MVENYKGFDDQAIANETQPIEHFSKRIGEIVAPKVVKIEFPDEDWLGQ